MFLSLRSWFYAPLTSRFRQSGTAELGDDAQGAYLSEKVWSDLNISDIEALPPTALHRPVDLTIVAADLEGYVRTHIILPAMVYGIATGSLFDAGISNPHTIAIPLYVRSALKDGKVAILNKGASAWGMVHINDSKCRNFRPRII